LIESDDKDIREEKVLSTPTKQTPTEIDNVYVWMGRMQKNSANTGASHALQTWFKDAQA
jgi:hypothetical protein